MPARLSVWMSLILLAVAFSACDFFDGDPQEPIDPNPLPREVADSLYVVSSTGLKYYDFFVGDGAVADSGSVVQVHYHGWLVDNTLFDSSVFRGVPLLFQLGTGNVIKGWDEGIEGMRVGGERQLVIPPNLGYGVPGRGAIPPNATLIFEVVVLAVE